MAVPAATRVRRRRLAWFAVGVLLLLAAAWLVQQRVAFLAQAPRADGVVVDMLSRGGDEPTFEPVVRWRDAEGVEHDLETGFASDPPRWSLGEKVTVRALPGQPGSAIVESVSSLWGWAAFGLFGGLLALVGARPLLREWSAARLGARLRREGTEVTALFLRVEQHGFPVAGITPRRIVATWTDFATGATHELASGQLWFDPTPWARDRGEITAYVDPRDPRVHCLELSFLPKHL